MKQNLKLALFDFDGTITTRDSFLDFLFYVSKLKFLAIFILLTPVILLYVLHIIPNWKLKELVLTLFFRGMDYDKFQLICSDYSSKRLPLLIRADALDRINWHKNQGHQIQVVTASLENYLVAWCHSRGMGIIGTKLEVRNNRITGKLDGKNCYGKEKINRIKKECDLKNYSYIYAYGDTSADEYMLSLANEKYYRWKRVE